MNENNSKKKKKGFCSARSLIWTAIFGSGTIGLLVHLAIQTLYFTEDQKYVSVLVSDTDFIFPDLTFCKIQKYNLKKYNTLSMIGDMNQTITYSAILSRMQDFWEFMPTEADADVIQLVDRSMRKVAFTFDLYEPPVAEILDCMLSQQKCTFKHFIVEKHPSHFFCYTFSLQESENMNYNDGLQILFANWEKVISSMTSNIEMEVKNYIVSIHKRGTKPNLINQALFARHLYIHLIDISHTITSKLSKFSSPCIEDRGTVTYIVDFNTNETRTFLATQDDCELVKRQEFFVDRCQCLDSENYVPRHLGGYKLCHEIDRKYYLFATYQNPPPLLNPELDNLIEAYKDGVVQRYRCFQNATRYLLDHPDVITECLPDCVTHAYTFSHQSQVAARLGAYKDRLIREQEIAYPANFSRYDNGVSTPIYIKFFASKPKATIFREVWAYPAKSYLSDVGGILGLWIGVSFITLFDIGDRMVKDMLQPSVKIIKQHTVRRATLQKSKAAAASTLDKTTSDGGNKMDLASFNNSAFEVDGSEMQSHQK